MKLSDLFILTVTLLCVSHPSIAQSSVGVSAPELSLQNSVVEIVYDILNSSVTDKFTIRIEVTDANGRYIQARTLSGDIGKHVGGGSDRKIFWNIRADSIFLDEEIFIQVYAMAEPPLIAEEPVQEKNPVVEGKPAEQEVPVAEDHSPLTTIQDQSSGIPDLANENLAETSGGRSFSRAGVILQSLALPGLGLSRLQQGKPHWIKGVIGYGCIAGSLYLNHRAADSYTSYQNTGSLSEVDILYQQSERQDIGSEVLAYTAIGIWVMDLTWNIIATADWNMARSASRSRGFSFGTSIEPASSVPLLTCRYKF